ncbi:MAG TPA: hypothetical protein VGH22_19520 [Candidatus Binatia bacterium]|jgi:dCTP deaminase
MNAINSANFFETYQLKPLPRKPDGSFKLAPSKFVGITREYVELPRKSKIAARVEGRSTLARLGPVVHITAPTIHSGFLGKIVLEVHNFGTYRLRPVANQLDICQLIFERIGKVPSGPINTRYLQQKTVRQDGWRKFAFNFGQQGADV